MSDAKALIDWNALIEICDDEEIIHEIARSICDDAPKVMDNIFQALEEDNLENLRLYAHRMKGASATVGATNLSAKAAALEQAARDGDLKKAESLIDALKIQADEVVALLERPDWIEAVKT